MARNGNADGRRLDPDAKPYKLCAYAKFRTMMKEIVSREVAVADGALNANPACRFLGRVMTGAYAMTGARPERDDEDVVEFVARYGISREQLEESASEYAYRYAGIRPSTTSAAIDMFDDLDPNAFDADADADADTALALELHRAIWNLQKTVRSSPRNDAELLAERARKVRRAAREENERLEKARVADRVEAYIPGLPECIVAEIVGLAPPPVCGGYDSGSGTEYGDHWSDSDSYPGWSCDSGSGAGHGDHRSDSDSDDVFRWSDYVD